MKIQGFTNADWEGSPSERNSTSGGIFSIGSTAISWYNRKQRLVALNLAEAEYMSTSQAAYEASWMRKILVCLFGQQMDLIVIYCANQSCIKLSENPFFHDRSKHIQIRYHFIRDHVHRGIVKLEYVSTDEQVVNILTKSLPRGKHVYFMDKMGVVSNTFLGKREC